MKREQAALFYKAHLENPNILEEKIIREFYKTVGKADFEIEKLVEEYRAFIDDAKKRGFNGFDIIHYLTAPRDTFTRAELDKDGNITNTITKEGDPMFDPSRKIDLSPYTGSNDFTFDDNTNTKNTIVSEENIPVFGDKDNPNSNIKAPKIEGKMSIIDMIIAMAEGNYYAVDILSRMMKDPQGILEVLYCDSLEIRGSKLYMLYNDCCDKNMDKFYRTLKMFKSGVFTEKQIHSNLGLIKAIPFIDDSIKVEGVPEYGSDKEFGLNDPKWEEYCNLNKEAFVKKLNSALGQTGGIGGLN